MGWFQARSIGGLCSRVLRFTDGTSLEGCILAHALGRVVISTPMESATGVLMLPVARAGVLRAVEGRAEAIAVPGITGLTLTIPIGQVVQPLPEGDRYLGFVFAAGETAEVVETALRMAHSHLRAIID